MRVLPLAAALVAAGLTPLAPAQAQTAAATPEVAVRVTDLDLSTPAGVRRLDQRLVRAASAVCEIDAPATLAAMNRRWACQQAALSRVAPRRDALIAHARRQTPTLASRD
ncbi:UrcA family protein [Sphingomonas sp.]|uniref:UrcA family protein n=1 Tax=Sphingomonas sp. TaxID=28214 RepID=UPI001D946972|nr:UrcA family protein [Sphingomonas sp.]MBX9797450.1 UrcA family protein [Sphingomonas sp.]